RLCRRSDSRGRFRKGGGAPLRAKRWGSADAGELRGVRERPPPLTSDIRGLGRSNSVRDDRGSSAGFAGARIRGGGLGGGAEPPSERGAGVCGCWRTSRRS